MKNRSRRLLFAFSSSLLIFVLGAFSFYRLFDEPSRVINPRPRPAFEIPEKVPGRNYIYFIAMGDQGTGGAGQRRIAELMDEKAQRDSLQFVLLLGDNFYPSGVISASDSQWQAKFVKMYDRPFLNVPFYATLGNHDHRQNRAGFQVEYAKLNPKWIMPTSYYTFTKKIDGMQEVQFFALDSERLAEKEEFEPEQLAWLERELQASRAKWKIVFGHHPVFSYGFHGHKMRMVNLVRPLLEKYEVDLYLCGHDHDRQMLQPIGGVHYIVCGTGGKSRDTAYGPITTFAETNLGFTWFRLSAEDLHVQFVDGDGKIEYAYTWAKGSVAKRPYEPRKVIDKSIRPGRDDEDDPKSWWRLWK